MLGPGSSGVASGSYWFILGVTGMGLRSSGSLLVLTGLYWELMVDLKGGLGATGRVFCCSWAYWFILGVTGMGFRGSGYSLVLTG